MEVNGRRSMDDGDTIVRRTALSDNNFVKANSRDPRTGTGADFMARDFDEDAFRAAYGLG